jgi:stage II sporulation protein AA (anti-sigma F factor antagonist)
MRSHLHVRRADGVAEATLVGCPRFSAENGESIRGELLGLADEIGGARMVLDLGGVEYLSSTGLTVLLVLKKKLEAASARLTLSNLTPQVKELFSATHLGRFFDILERRPATA